MVGSSVLVQTLESWELGDGILTTMGNSSGQDMNPNLVFDRIWNNQTSEYGIVTSQIIEAKGFGVLDINSTIDGTNFDLDGNVSQAWYNRTMIDGVVDEKTILEANGNIYIDESTNESTTIVEGEISTIYIETHDYNGTVFMIINNWKEQLTLCTSRMVQDLILKW